MKGAAVRCSIKIFRLTWDFYNYTTTVHEDDHTIKMLKFTVYLFQLPVCSEATVGEPEILQLASSSYRTRFPNFRPSRVFSSSKVKVGQSSHFRDSRAFFTVPTETRACKLGCLLWSLQQVCDFLVCAMHWPFLTSTQGWSCSSSLPPGLCRCKGSRAACQPSLSCHWQALVEAVLFTNTYGHQKLRPNRVSDKTKKKK